MGWARWSRSKDAVLVASPDLPPFLQMSLVSREYLSGLLISCVTFSAFDDPAS